MLRTTLLSRAIQASFVIFGLTSISPGATDAFGQTIQSLPPANTPIPIKRPALPVSEITGSVPTYALTIAPAQSVAEAQTLRASKFPVSSGRMASVTAVNGSFKDGMNALTSKKVDRALSIRAGMPGGSLERKTLAWAIALSGLPGIPSGEISAIARDLPEWPGQEAMRRNAEEALARESLSADAIINAFARNAPETVTGARLLAGAHLAKGNVKAANAVIGPVWRNDNLTQSEEQSILKQFENVLTREDHRFRMHMQFYRERSAPGLRMGGLAEQFSLAKARAAVIRNDKNADKLLDEVAASSKADTGYLYAKIKRARRTEDYREAARLMLSAPRDPALLVNPDEWWIERRLISRGLLDLGDPKTAYRIAAGHSAESNVYQAEAEFHAGWYALRFLNDNRAAQGHFANILRVSSTPISQARGHYWLGRSHSGAEATKHYRAAALHRGTFYGQLAAQKLGQARLNIEKPNPSAADRSRFANHELVRAIELLEASDYGWRANTIYRDMALNLNSPGELALLAARAERNGDHTLALQIGKIGHSRGLEVDTVSWPIGAIPANAQIGDTGKALAYSIARQESAFNPRARSPANALGLLQLLPGTAKLMARKTGMQYSQAKLTSDPGYNAQLGAAYLSEQLDNFSNSYILTFIGYNAGPGRAKEWIERFGDPRNRPIDFVVDWIERIPFTETRNYVQRVMENYQVYKSRLMNARLDIEGDLVKGRQ